VRLLQLRASRHTACQKQVGINEYADMTNDEFNAEMTGYLGGTQDMTYDEMMPGYLGSTQDMTYEEMMENLTGNLYLGSGSDSRRNQS
jgi:hypothetical protein